jgi:hypothetical protein
MALDFNRPAATAKMRPIVPLDHRTVNRAKRRYEEYRIDNLLLKENKDILVNQVEAQKAEIDMQKQFLVTRQANTLSAAAKAQQELKVAKASASLAQDAADNANCYLADTEAKLAESQVENEALCNDNNNNVIETVAEIVGGVDAAPYGDVPKYNYKRLFQHVNAFISGRGKWNQHKIDILNMRPFKYLLIALVIVIFCETLFTLKKWQSAVYMQHCPNIYIWGGTGNPKDGVLGEELTGTCVVLQSCPKFSHCGGRKDEESFRFSGNRQTN